MRTFFGTRVRLNRIGFWLGQVTLGLFFAVTATDVALSAVQDQAVPEDVQKAFFAYFDCAATEARKLDDGKSDPALIAEAVRPRCHRAWTKAIASNSTTAAGGPQEIDELENENTIKTIVNERAKRAH